MNIISRRHFLQATSAATALAGLGMLTTASQNAFAANISGYKALVCVFLKGGMDHADTVLPFDQSSYDQLAGHRSELFTAYGVGSGNSSRDRENLLQLAPTNSSDFSGAEFALPQELAPLKTLFDEGDAAIIGNVGPLIEPTTRTSMGQFGAAIPKRLFSHNDQQSTWMSQGTEGTQQGWGGRFADLMVEADVNANPAFAAISTSGNDVFLSGNTVRQFAAPLGNSASLKYIDKRSYFGSGRNADDARQLLKDHFASLDMASTNLFDQDVAGYNSRAVENLDTFFPAIQTAPPMTTAFPDSSLAQQLASVAEIISVRQALNASRQIFYVTMGGYDTHSAQAATIPALHTQLAEGIAAFNSAMVELGLNNDVTLFTCSDFGRTTGDNGDGTDHGWGAHQFVVGGAVNGNRIYGEMPPLDLGLETYTESRGRLIPSVSVDQYAATLGEWFGLSSGEVGDILPNLANFSQTNLGFV